MPLRESDPGLSCGSADHLQSLPCTLPFIAPRIEVHNPGFGEYGGPFGPRNEVASQFVLEFRCQISPLGRLVSAILAIRGTDEEMLTG